MRDANEIRSESSYRALGWIPDDTEEDRDRLARAATHWITALEESKWPRALQHFENVSYLLGNHTTRFFMDSARGFGMSALANSGSPVDAIIAKSADNRLIRPSESVVGMLTRSRPTPNVTPNSDLPEDEDAAAISALLLELLFEKPINMPVLRRDAAMLMILTGDAIAETEYGETDSPVEIPKFKSALRRNPFHDPKDEATTGPAQIAVQEPDGVEIAWRRDLSCDLYSHFQITPDPAATSLEKLFWISRGTFQDLDWVRERYDVDAEGFHRDALKDVGSVAPSRHVLFWWNRFQDILETPHMSASSMSTLLRSELAPNQTSEHVIDVRPTSAYPRGRTLVLAGGKLIYSGVARARVEDRYRDRWHKYAKSSWFRVPGRFWGIPLMTLLLPLQKKINSIDALVQASRELISLGQWLLPKQCKVKPGTTGGIPGLNVEYTAQSGFKPEKIQNIPLPAELFAERAQLIRAIDDLAAARTVDSDEVGPSAARAGSILNYLRAEKMESKTPMIGDFEQFLESIGQNALIEIQQNLVDEDPELTRRVQAAAREKSSVAIEAFTGASLRDHHAVRIDITSDLIHSPEAAEEQAMTFLQARGQNATPAEVNAVMRATRLDKYLRNQQDASIDKARRMIRHFVTGKLKRVLVIEGVDEPALMAEEFRRELLLERAFDYPPEAYKLIMEAFDTYSAMAQQAAAQAFQQQVAATAALANAQNTGKGQPMKVGRDGAGRIASVG